MKNRMIYRLSAGLFLTLGILTFAALRIDTTGSYERTFNAAPDRLWHVWSDSDLIKKWWGPKDYSAPIVRNDARVGGTYLWSMRSPKGEMSWTTGVYKEILPNSRIVSTMSFADSGGRAIPGSKAPVPGHWPDQILVTTEFTESHGKTTVRVTEVGVPLIVAIVARIAWSQQFDKIETLLQGQAQGA
jgi:uncharacterized protein YndB with AHSA1/START domain